MATVASATIGRRLFLARTRRKMTMAELGGKAGVSASAVNHIEKGNRSPSAEIVEFLARALEIDPCWLAYGTGAKPEWDNKSKD